MDSTYEFLSQRYVLLGLTVVPAILLFAFVNLFPIVWAVVASFFSISAFNPVWRWAGAANYTDVLWSSDFWLSMWRSVIFAVGTVSIQLVGGVGIALLLKRSFRFNKMVRAVVLLPYLIPSAIIGFLAIWMGNSNYGIVNWILVDAGLLDQPIAWYGTREFAMLSAVLVESWRYVIFVTLMVLARLQSIPDDFYEAADIAGANAWQKFRDITLPQLRGVIFIVLLLRGIWNINKFDIIFVLTQGGPGDATTTAPIYAYETAFNFSQLGKAAAISTLLFGVLVIAAVIYFKVLEPEKEIRVQ